MSKDRDMTVKNGDSWLLKLTGRTEDGCDIVTAINRVGGERVVFHLESDEEFATVHVNALKGAWNIAMAAKHRG